MKRAAIGGLLIATLLCTLAGLAATAPRTFSVAAPPAWVAPVEIPQADEGKDARDGVLDLLYDTQIRVSSAGIERYHHIVTKVLTAAGLEEASQLQLDFDPSDERLVVHSIALHRGDATIDALKPNDIRIIQPERDLDDQIVTGEMSAVALLRDVRVGDVIDYAYSLNSQTTFFGGRFAEDLYFGADFPIRRVTGRLLWPAARPVWFKNLNTDIAPVRRDLAGATEYVWTRDRAPAVKTDSDSPSWYDPTPVVQVSEWATWGDVVHWALPFYASDKPLPADLERQVTEWKALEKPEDRLLAASRFVQDQIRYTGIELGPSSYIPASPAEVYERRFGDCKDKALMLSTILKELGIEAYPALVNTSSGSVLQDWQPSPLSFDHCIVRATLGQDTVWIDATTSLSRGDIAQHRNPDLGSALVIREGSTALEQIASTAGDAPTVVVDEVFTLMGDDAKLEVTTTYRGPEADDIRYSLADSSVEEVGDDVVEYYSQEFAAIEPEGLPDIKDDEDQNIIVIVEKYRIAQFWEDGARTLTADRVDGYLSSSRATRRNGPLAVSYPVDVRQTIEVRSGRPLEVRSEAATIGDEAVRFSYNFAPTDNGAKLEYQFKTLRDSVPASRVAQHRETIRRIRKVVGYTIRQDGLLNTGFSSWGVLAVIAIILLPLAGVIALLWWRARRDGARLAAQLAAISPVPVRGDSPATAIVTATEDDRKNHLAGLRCRCGSLYVSSVMPPSEQTMIYDGRTITLLTLTCSRCGAQRDLYLAGSPVIALE